MKVEIYSCMRFGWSHVILLLVQFDYITEMKEIYCLGHMKVQFFYLIVYQFSLRHYIRIKQVESIAYFWNENYSLSVDLLHTMQSFVLKYSLFTKKSSMHP